MANNFDSIHGPKNAADAMAREWLWFAFVVVSLMLAGVGIIGCFRWYRLLELWETVALDAAWLIVAALLLKFAYLPIRSRHQATIALKATPAIVWDTIRPRERDDFYRADVARISAVGSEPGVYRYHARTLASACSKCGHPSHPSHSTISNVMKITEEDPYRHFVMQQIESDAKVSTTAKGELVAWSITPRAHGTNVNIALVFDSPKLWFWLFLTITGSKPAQFILDDLRYSLDGGAPPREGGLALCRERLEAIKKVRQYCECP